ncbi:MAG: tryptophan-rich sensory protein TspO [Alkalilacustris sp.]
MDWLLFSVFLFACAAAGTTGAMFEPGAWYRSLAKPRWTPPNWLFPVAWSFLYIAMSLAAMRVALAGDSALALALWSAQIAFNTLWTPVFFGLKRMGAAMGVMVALWLSVAATMVAFWQVDLIAGLLFVPYLAWVTVAGALNFSVWRLNRDMPAPA